MSKPSGKVLLRMPTSLHEQLRARAETEGVSLNQFLVSVAARAVGEGELGKGSEQDAFVFELDDRLARQERELAAVETAGRDLRRQVGAELDELDQRVADLEDERYAAKWEGFKGGAKMGLGGTAPIDSGKDERRARLDERAAARFDHKRMVP
jgi:hypothetical protein